MISSVCSQFYARLPKRRLRSFVFGVRFYCYSSGRRIKAMAAFVNQNLKVAFAQAHPEG